MLRIYYLILVISFFSNCQSDSLDPAAQVTTLAIPIKTLKIVNVTPLDKVIGETSGVINFDGRIITHNDSGGEAALYEIDIANGQVKRSVIIKNAKNIDWEDITQDDNYIYLCDIGNNSNTRKDQVIYKISKSDYLKNKEVIAEIIEISFTEQTNFTKSNKETNFDAEAVVSLGDYLFLFTKNWGDLKTSVYKIPKEKGVYKLQRTGSYDIKGLVTGADYSKNNDTILLTGYSSFIPFVVIITNFPQDNPLGGKIEKKRLNVNGSLQIEGIAANPDGSYYLTAEKMTGFTAMLYRLTY